jgi:hypothetical protein
MPYELFPYCTVFHYVLLFTIMIVAPHITIEKSAKYTSKTELAGQWWIICLTDIFKVIIWPINSTYTWPMIGESQDMVCWTTILALKSLSNFAYITWRGKNIDCKKNSLPSLATKNLKACSWCLFSAQSWKRNQNWTFLLHSWSHMHIMTSTRTTLQRGVCKVRCCLSSDFSFCKASVKRY